MDGWGGGAADKARDLAGRCTQNASTATSLAAEGGCRFRAIPEEGEKRWPRSPGQGCRFEGHPKSQEGDGEVNNSVSNSGPSCCAHGPQSRPLRRTPVSPSLDRRGHRGPERRGVPEVLTPTHLLFLVYLLSHPTRERWGKQRPRAAGNWLLSARGKPRGPDSRSGAPPRSSCPMLSRGAPNFTKPAHWG